MLLTRPSRQKPLAVLTRRLLHDFTGGGASSALRDTYNFHPPPSLHSTPHNPYSNPKLKPNKKKKPLYRPPSSLDTKPVQSDLPFDFRYSYTESSPDVRPIGLRVPKYSPFGPARLARPWTGVCAPAQPITLRSVDPAQEDLNQGQDLDLKRRITREEVQGQPLSEAERKAVVETCRRGKTKRQVNLGRHGLTHNMLDEIHSHWTRSEAVRIKCMGVPTLDMTNVCAQLEDKTFGAIVSRKRGLIVLYRGRHYNPKRRPAIPLMLWKPHEPVYPRLIKTTVEGLSVEETKRMRKRGLAVPALTRLGKNGFYGSLVTMVRDAFIAGELVRIDCKGLDKSDCRRIGYKLRDLVPCVLVTFDKEQIVVWRGKGYVPPKGVMLFGNLGCDDRSGGEGHGSSGNGGSVQQEFHSGDEDEDED